MNKETLGVNTINALRASIIENGNVLDYENRIPVATRENLKDIGKALFEYKPALNEFLNELINKIGLTYIHSKLYTNKLAFLKRGMLEWGDTIEEIFVDIVKANTYSPVPANGEESDVFAVNKPNVISAFHKVNREDVYPITINEKMLQRAFLSYNNFDKFIAEIFNSLYKSDQFDEFLLFKQLIGETFRNSKAVKVVKPIDKTTSENFSIQLRAYGLNLEYMSRDYNQAGVATSTPLDEQILLLRSDVVPVMDVTQLANNFNMNLAQPISGRIIVIDDFGQGNDDIIGGIIDSDFSMIYDILFTSESIYNPKHRYWNWFLHHQQVIASSPFANAVSFTTQDIVFNISSLTVIPNAQEIRKGYSNQVHTIVDFVGDGDTSYVYSIAGGNSNDTKIDQDGTVYVGADETATTLTITATSNAKFGSSDPKAVTGSATVTVID